VWPALAARRVMASWRGMARLLCDAFATRDGPGGGQNADIVRPEARWRLDVRQEGAGVSSDLP
jgi:hypothetical protein